MSTGNLSLATPAASPLTNGICVGVVSGGQDTNPLWVSKVSTSGFKAALQASLAANGLAAPEDSCGFDLDARLTQLKQPFIGISMTVTGTVGYEVRRTGESAPQFETTVTAPYTATFGDSPIGFIRLKLANEGAIKTNIATMLRELIAAPVAQPAPTSGEQSIEPTS
jgi:hypothetical protein